ncbi:MAG: hypothetical protein ACYS9X_18405 [Planctomycetota bacterium]|jgi:hypothetical protein
MMRRFAVMVVGAALLIAANAEARGGGGGGGGGGGRAGGGFGFREEAPPFRWFDTRDQAIAAAAGVQPALPVMCFLRRANGAADRQYAHVIFARRDMAFASRRDFAAFRVDTRTDEGKEIVKRRKIRRDGALLWFDSHGNYVSRVDQALKLSHILGTIQQWSALLGKLEREVAKLVRDARGHLARERYASALKTLAPVADLKGPPAEGVREILGDVEKRGNGLLSKIDKLDHGRTGRTSLLICIAGEFRGSSVEARARRMAGAATDAGEGARERVESVAGPVPGPAAAEAPDMPDPSIEMMLREVEKDVPEGEGAAAPRPSSTAPAPAETEGRSPDELISASRERQRAGTDLLKADDDVGAFMALTEALDLAAAALEKKPGHVATRRFAEGVASQRYECYKSLIE